MEKSGCPITLMPQRSFTLPDESELTDSLYNFHKLSSQRKPISRLGNKTIQEMEYRLKLWGERPLKSQVDLKSRASAKNSHEFSSEVKKKKY